MVETRLKKANKILKIIGLSLAGIAIVFVLVIGSLCLFSGYKVLWVMGDSSVQGIKPYSLILVKPCKVEDLIARDVPNGIKMGDFAVRKSGTGYVTHEVVTVKQNESGEWVFDTKAAGDDRTTQTDGNGGFFKQKDLAGKVVGQESFIGKLMAWIQGYPDISTTFGGRPSKTLAIVRIVTLAAILYAITKFAEFMAYKEDIY